MAQFILFYVNGPGEPPPELPPDELQSLISEYTAWGEKLSAEGRMIGGARLTSVWSDPGRQVSGSGADFLVTDGPLAESKEVVGGYAVIEARDYADAVQACRDHPHLRGNRIVIRQLA